MKAATICSAGVAARTAHRVPIGELCHLITNGYVGPVLEHQTPEADGVPYLQGWNIRRNKIDTSRLTRVTAQFHQSAQKSQLRAGDVLVVQSGHIGTAAVVEDHLNDANCHALIIIRCDRSKVDPHYLAQYINSPTGQRRLAGLHVGSSLPHINTSELAKFEVPVPELSTQRHIVLTLSSWERAEALLAARASLNRSLRTGLERRLFERSRAARGKLLRADALFTNSSIRAAGGERLLSVTQDRGIVPRDENSGRVASPAGSLDSYKRVEPGQFVVSLRSFQGGIEYSEVSGIVSPAYTVLAASSDSVDPRYFRHYFKSEDFIRRLGVAVIGIRDGKQISWNDFRSVKLPVPPLSEQARMAGVLDCAEREMFASCQALERTEQQRAALLARLIPFTI